MLRSASLHWQKYADLASVKTVSIRQGIELLLRHWPQNTGDFPAAIRKRVLERVRTARLKGEFHATGAGVTARVSPEAFFEWAVCWEDRRGSSDQKSLMQAAALNFGAPSRAWMDGEMPEFSFEGQAVQSPRDCEEAEALAREYQLKYLDALAEVDQLRKEVASLRPDAEAYRELKAKRRADGRRSGGRRY